MAIDDVDNPRGQDDLNPNRMEPDRVDSGRRIGGRPPIPVPVEGGAAAHHQASQESGAGREDTRIAGQNDLPGGRPDDA